MPKFLRNVHSVVDFGYWVQGRYGVYAREGPGPFGPVNNVHGTGSWHYVYQALDINHPIGATNTEAEHEILVKIYKRVLEYKSKHPNFPLAEMFHRNLGYKDDYGTGTNVPISNHDTHLHTAFTRKTW